MAVSESIHSRRKVVAGSNRTFGIVFSCFFTFVGLSPLASHHSPRLWAFGLAGLFLAAGLLAPSLLKPLNQLWFRLGLTLHRVVSPIVMLLIYYGAIVPLGLILQVGGKDLLRLKWEPDATSYWIPRQPPGPTRGSMSKQF